MIVMRHLLNAAAGLCAALMLGGATAPEAIKIGAFLDVTGPAAMLGDPEAKTLKLYVDQINRGGGVLGRPIRLILHDTAGNTDQAVTLVKHLVEIDKVHLLIGGSTTTETVAAAKLADAAKTPMISLAAGFAIFQPMQKWVFATPHSDTMAIHRVLNELQKRGMHRIAMIGGSSLFDESCRGSLQSLAREHAVTIVVDERYGGFAPIMTHAIPQLVRIQHTPGVQAIVACGFGAPANTMLANYAALGMQDIPLYFTHGVGSHRFIDIASGAANGVRLPVTAVVVADQLGSEDPQKPIALAYRAAYLNAYEEAVSTFGGHAYDALMIAVDAIMRARTTDADKLRDAIESTRDFVGLSGTFNMSPTDHVGLTMESLKMVEIRDNHWQLLKWAY
ncbi:MAG: ABC transporter substrate-binding protein [Proteobacteria bacterium]|nr:ABC transporter substrate-binding protein [Pseudomonadota bacterium]